MAERIRADEGPWQGSGATLCRAVVSGALGAGLALGGTSAVGQTVINTDLADSMYILNGDRTVTIASGSQVRNSAGQLVTIGNGAQVFSISTLQLNTSDHGTSIFTVDGANITVNMMYGQVQIGNAGTGILNITNGARLLASSNSWFEMAWSRDSKAYLNIDGAGSTFTVTNMGPLYVIHSGAEAVITITNGGNFSSSGGDTILADESGNTTVTIDGAGSSWTNSAGLIVGGAGTASVNITNGGSMSSRQAVLGSSKYGEVTLSGAGSIWTNAGSMIVGQNGIGVLTLSNDGRVETPSSITLGASGGTGTLNIGAAAGEAAVAPGTLATAGGSSTAPGISLSSASSVVFNHTDTNYTFASPIMGMGFINHLSGTTILTGANSYYGATTVAGGTLKAGAANTFSQNSAVSLASGATLDANGLNQTVSSLANAGIVNVGNATPTAGATLTVTNNYTGNGGSLRLNTVLGDDSSATDKLHVAGNVTGSTTLLVTNAGGAGAQTSNGIQVVQVDGTSDAPSPDGKVPNPGANFKLGNTVEAGAYEYILQSNGENWYLVSEAKAGPPGTRVPVYRAGVSNYLSGERVNTEVGQLQLATLHQRAGEHRTLPLEKQSWARTYYSRLEEDGKTRFGYDADIYGMQIGHELLAKRTEDGGTLRAAISFDYARANADMSDKTRPAFGLNRHTGTLESDSYAIGGYLTKTYSNGAYIDMVGQAGWIKNNYDTKRRDGTKDESTQKGWRFGISAEGGYPLWQSSQWLLEGQGQLSYQYTGYRGFTDDISRVDSYGADNLRGRLGVRLVHTEKLKENRTLEIYGIANVLHDFLNPDSVPVQSDGAYKEISERYGSTWGEIGFGMQGWLTKNTSVFGDVRYQHGFSSPDGGDPRAGGSFNIGIRHTF